MRSEKPKPETFHPGVASAVVSTLLKRIPDVTLRRLPMEISSCAKSP